MALRLRLSRRQPGLEVKVTDEVDKLPFMMRLVNTGAEISESNDHVIVDQINKINYRLFLK
jgi:hypothetical protein